MDKDPRFLIKIRNAVAGLRDHLLAFFHLSDRAVCEQSWLHPGRNYHDERDSVHGIPEHFITHHCKRCGKEFTI